jgi:hypothetical protein
MAKIVLESVPNEGRGIFTSVNVICSDSNDIKTFSKHFWLPQQLLAATLRLRDYVHINRIMDIEDVRCTKHVHFKIKSEPTIWFFKIVKTLKDVGVHITSAVEASYVKNPNEIVSRLRDAGVEEVEVR